MTATADARTVRAPAPARITPGGVAEPGRAAAPDRRLTALRRFALSITVLTVAGHLLLGFEQSPVTPLLSVLTAYSVELLLEWLDSRARGRAPRYAQGGRRQLIDFLLPAHIAGLACAMLLYSNATLWPVLFAVAVGIGLKYVIRVPVAGRPRHVLNPSNAGISLTLLLFHWVGIAPPYQFTSNVGAVVDWLVPLIVLLAGTLLNGKLTGKLPLIGAWVGGFVVQAGLRALLLGHALLPALLPMTGVAFILFTNYMITDPGTTPTARRGQVAFGLTVAACYGILVSLHVVFGLFFALTLTCLLRAGVLLLASGRERWRTSASAGRRRSAVPA